MTGKRGKFKRRGEAEATAELPAPVDVLKHCEPSQLLDSALVAFDASFSAIYAQAVVEARRLGRLNAALDRIEGRLLDPELIDSLSEAQAGSLMQVLQYNARGSTQTLLEISKTIMSSRATTTILANLRQIAMSYHNGGQGPAPIESGGSGNGQTRAPNTGGKMAQRFNGR